MKHVLYAAWIIGWFCVGYYGTSLYLSPRVTDEASVVEVVLTGGHGSGVYIGNGQIITAGHVGKDGPNVVIQTPKGQTVGVVQWVDEKADVALITITDMLPGLEPAKLACEAPDAVVGDAVESIGYPLDFINAHIWGRIAVAVAQYEKQTALVADMTVAPGNSGGPVFSSHHTIVGITVAGALTQLFGQFPSLLALSFIIPKSVICGELKASHDAPVFAEEGNK